MDNLLLNISEIEIKYNPRISPRKRPCIGNSRQAYQQFMQVFKMDDLNIKEEAVVLYLNRGNRVIGAYKASSGGITGTVVDIRLILAVALKCLATGIMIAHSHPSGELKPSRTDENYTAQLKQAAKLMDIKLFDHLIITTEGYYSFEDEGIL
jgi:DNA repair protein RadC